MSPQRQHLKVPRLWLTRRTIHYSWNAKELVRASGWKVVRRFKTKDLDENSRSPLLTTTKALVENGIFKKDRHQVPSQWGIQLATNLNLELRPTDDFKLVSGRDLATEEEIVDRGILWPQHGNVWSMEPNKSLNRESLIIATELALLGRKFGEKFEVPKHEMESTCRVLVEELFRACGFSNWNTHVASRLIRGLEILSCEL